MPDKSHSGTEMGIMAGVRNDGRPNATVEAILRCMQVTDDTGYTALRKAFAAENTAHQAIGKRLETEHVPVLPDREYIHDPSSMVIFRLFDAAGLGVSDVNLLLTAGPDNSLDQLPSGFMIDCQANQRQAGNLTFFLNHSVLTGCPAVPRDDGSIARPELVPRPPYGIRLEPRQTDQFVEYWSAALDTSVQELLPLLRPNETTLIDIRLSRIVHEGVAGFTTRLAPRSFKNVEPGGVVT